MRSVHCVNMFFALNLLGLVVVPPSLSFGIHQSITYKCTQRWDLSKPNEHDAMQVNCSAIKASNPICGQDVNISYSNLPPFVYWNKDKLKVDGSLVSKCDCISDSNLQNI